MASALRYPALRRNSSDCDLQNFLGYPVRGRRLHIVCVGAHPDDPETGCGGTLAKFTRDGHRVTLLYLTRGEAGSTGCDHTTTAGVRTAEAFGAAAILGADAIFAGQIDGKTSAGPQEARSFTALIRDLRPDILLSHWEQDTHRDHRHVAELARSAWNTLGRSFTLAFYEVMAGIQTYNFSPNVYVDVSSSNEQKRAAVYAHVCQNPDRFYPHHVKMEKDRGAEAWIERAEAFYVVRQAPVIPITSGQI
jgi:LmbE family N-acetylglucosaminyl deacetylase